MGNPTPELIEAVNALRMDIQLSHSHRSIPVVITRLLQKPETSSAMRQILLSVYHHNDSISTRSAMAKGDASQPADPHENEPMKMIQYAGFWVPTLREQIKAMRRDPRTLRALGESLDTDEDEEEDMQVQPVLNDKERLNSILSSKRQRIDNSFTQAEALTLASLPFDILRLILEESRFSTYIGPSPLSNVDKTFRSLGQIAQRENTVQFGGKHVEFTGVPNYYFVLSVLFAFLNNEMGKDHVVVDGVPLTTGEEEEEEEEGADTAPIAISVDSQNGITQNMDLSLLETAKQYPFVQYVEINFKHSDHPAIVLCSLVTNSSTFPILGVRSLNDAPPHFFALGNSYYGKVDPSIIPVSEDRIVDWMPTFAETWEQNPSFILSPSKSPSVPFNESERQLGSYALMAKRMSELLPFYATNFIEMNEGNAVITLNADVHHEEIFSSDSKSLLPVLIGYGAWLPRHFPDIFHTALLQANAIMMRISLFLEKACQSAGDLSYKNTSAILIQSFVKCMLLGLGFAGIMVNSRRHYDYYKQIATYPQIGNVSLEKYPYLIGLKVAKPEYMSEHSKVMRVEWTFLLEQFADEIKNAGISGGSMATIMQHAAQLLVKGELL